MSFVRPASFGGPAGKVVLITGASSGIGRAVALQFASQGAAVALLARNQDKLEEVAKEVEQLGGHGLILAADVSEREQVRAAIQGVYEHWGRIDVLVNNAGYVVYGSIEDCEVDDFARQMAVNYLGAVYATKTALPLMRRQGSGCIINVSSIEAKLHRPFNAAYAASKYALSAFTLALRRELAGTGISVSLVTPGQTDTGILKAWVQRSPVPGGDSLIHVMTTERVARAIAKCADMPRREVILPVVYRPMVLLYTLMPGLLERFGPVIMRFLASFRSFFDNHRSRGG